MTGPGFWTGGDARWPHDDVLHAWWVKPGQLLAGEYPASSTAAKTAHKARLLVEAGIDSVIDLTTPADGLLPYDEALNDAAADAGRQVRRFSHPIPDMGIINHDGYDQILDRIRGETDSDRTVYVHCWGGRGRTSTVIGCLLIDDGLGYRATIDRIAELRADTRKAQFPCPESRSQHRLLQDRVARRPSRPPPEQADDR